MHTTPRLVASFRVASGLESRASLPLVILRAIPALRSTLFKPAPTPLAATGLEAIACRPVAQARDTLFARISMCLSSATAQAAIGLEATASPRTLGLDILQLLPSPPSRCLLAKPY